MNALLGTTYVNQCIQGIIPIELEIAPENLAPVDNCRRGTKADVTTILSYEAPTNDQYKRTTIQDAKLFTIRPTRESPVVVGLVNVV